MSQIGEPGAATVAPVNEAPPAPVEGTGAPSPAPAAAPAPAAPPPHQALLDRIDRLTRDKYDLQRDLDLAKRGTVAAPPGGVPPQPAPTPAPSPAPLFDAAEIERRAEALATERAGAMQMQQRVGAIAAEGMKAYPAEWSGAVAVLQRINALDTDSINAIHELGNPHEVIMALGRDPNEAARIAALSPAQRGIAYARLSDKVKADAAGRISQAPAPAGSEVAGGAPTSSAPSDRDSMDAWAAKRKAQRTGGRAA